MSGREEDSDSDAPEEFTAEQAIQQDEEIQKVQKENKARIVREGKERRRQWAQKLTPRESLRVNKSVEDVIDTRVPEVSEVNKGMLSEDIVKLLTVREKKVFLSDSEVEETEKKTITKKKKPKNFGAEPVILTGIQASHCLQSSLEFLKKRKMQVSRSSAVLNNSNKALSLLSTSGLLSKK